MGNFSVQEERLKAAFPRNRTALNSPQGMAAWRTEVERKHVSNIEFLAGDSLLKRLTSLYRPAWPKDRAARAARFTEANWGVAKW
jgi:hypothetical protein